MRQLGARVEGECLNQTSLDLGIVWTEGAGLLCACAFNYIYDPDDATRQLRPTCHATCTASHMIVW